MSHQILIPLAPSRSRSRTRWLGLFAIACSSGPGAFAQGPSIEFVSAVHRVSPAALQDLSQPSSARADDKSMEPLSLPLPGMPTAARAATQSSRNEEARRLELHSAQAQRPNVDAASQQPDMPAPDAVAADAVALSQLTSLAIFPPATAATDGEIAGGLTLESLESTALASNPSIARAAAAVAAARGAAVQAGLPFNPVVGYEGQQIGSGGLAEQHGLLVGQEFLRHEKRTLSREVACREVRMAEYRLMAQRARVITDVRMAFYRAVRAQRQIDMSADLLRISEQAHKAAQALMNAKEIARTDVLQAQIEVEVARTALQSAHNQHASAWSQLAAVTGQSALQVAPLSGDLFAAPTPLEFDSALAWLRGQSPEVAEAITNVERARFNLQRQIVEPRPNVSVQSLYNFVDNGIGGKPDAALALSVPVPLWNRNQGAIQQARYQVAVAEQSLTQLELALQQRLAPVFERYANSKNLVQQYGQTILPAAAEALQLTQKTFEVGEIGFTNLLIVQRSYRQQQLVFLEAAEALRLSEAEINGLLLSGSLINPQP
jgi:cobalt-zinc-cadmium efflux system outer membrane protein